MALEAPEYPAMAGNFVVKVRKNLPSVIGQSAFDTVVETLPERFRDEFEGTTSLGWASLQMVNALVDGAAAKTGRDPFEINAALTRVNVEETIHGVWRIMLKAVTDKMLVKRAPRLYTTAYNRGTVNSEWLGDGRARLTITEWPEMDRYALDAGRIAIGMLFEHAGRQDVRVDVETTPDGAAIDLRWF